MKWVAQEGPEILEPLSQPAIGPRNLTINVRAHTRSYQEIFYKSALVFINNAQVIPQQMFAPPENCRRYGIEIISKQLNAQGNFIEVDFRLRGSDKSLTVSLPVACTEALTDQNGDVTDGSALKVWPRFSRPRWRDYFVYFATTDPAVTTEQIRIVGERAPDEAVLLGTTPRGKLQFAPSFIEISAKVKNKLGIERQYRACFYVGLTELKTSAEGQRCLLAVDFGTSSTCFSYSIMGGSPQPLELSDKTLTLVPGLQLEKLLAHSWLPELNREKLLPSELLFPNAPDKVFGAQRDLVPIVDYTIPPNKWRDHEEDLIVAGFKWLHAVKPASVKQNYEQLQRMYLELALKLAIAEIAEITQGTSSIDPFHVDMVVTYPLAMSDAEFRGLLGSYNTVQELVAEGTGIVLEEKATIDESLAGQYATQFTEGKEFILLDVGGGTTDMAVIEVSPLMQRVPRFVDSMHFAGNDFLEAIASDTTGRKISNASLIELERRIRVKDDKVLDDPSTFRHSNSIRNEAIEALERFLDGLIEYLARTIAVQSSHSSGVAASRKKTDVYLLGNGWRYISMLPPSNSPIGISDITIVVRDWISDRLDKRLEALKHAGIIQDIPDFDIHHPADPKIVVSSGALDLYMSSPETFTQIRREKREKRTFLGCNISVVATGSSQPFDWQREVPFDLTVAPLAVFMRQSLAGFEQTPVPVNQGGTVTLTDLQKVNIIREVRDPRMPKIVKSAFSVYMESWHKRWLNPRGWL